MSLESAIDLSSASAGALEDLKSSTAPTQDSSSTGADPAAPAGSGVPDPTATADAKPAQPAASAVDPDILEVKVNGKLERISISKDRDKLVELAQKGWDYTQKTQSAAAERQQIEQYAQALHAREQELQAFLTDPVKVTQYAQYLLSQQPQAAQASDPNAVATVAEVRQALQAEIAKVQEENQKAIAQAQFQAETARYQADYTADLTNVVRQSIEKFPILDSIADGPEDLFELLKGDLAKKGEGSQPATIDEAREAISALAKSRADRLHAKVTDHAKMEAVRAAKQRATGPEPPGGSAPAPQSGAAWKLGDPRLTAQVIADLTTNRG